MDVTVETDKVLVADREVEMVDNTEDNTEEEEVAVEMGVEVKKYV